MQIARHDSQLDVTNRETESVRDDGGRTDSVEALDQGTQQLIFSPDTVAALLDTKACDKPLLQEAFLLRKASGRSGDVLHLCHDEITTIGRDEQNTVALPDDDRCSRAHCQVLFQHGVWYVRDLDSRNGTRVNEQYTYGCHALQPGDVIRVGRTRFVLRVGSI